MLRSELPTRADSGNMAKRSHSACRGGRFAKQGIEHQAASGVILWPG